MDTKPTVLVVDDEEKNLRLFTAYLEPEGYNVVVAHDGEEGIEKVKEHDPDVILLDVMMPRKNGYETARYLKENEETKIIPIVMVTALNEVKDRVKAIEAGTDDFLSKPVDHFELKARVKSLIKIKAYNVHMRDYQKVLESEVVKRTEQLSKAYSKIKAASLETIFGLTHASEYKDVDTGAHIMRMSHYTAAITRKMGYSEKVVESVLYSAPMHDVGKIGIPDKVLLKPGKLDPAEWNVMMQHTTIGAKILEDSITGFAKLGSMIALNHHEKWDGTGYPNGLAGKEIPLLARITAVGDVFDALMSKRPYKEPFSLEKSLSIIKEDSGKHFDPEVIDAFLSIIDEILEIKEKYKDDEGSKYIEITSQL
ncbi:response regulator [Candidatus Latescibacterota bacterium]